MPKKKKGGRHQTRKQIKRGERGGGAKRELEFAGEGQVYAMVRGVLGGGRFRLQCSDGSDRLGILRGAMHKRAWVREGHTVLVGLRDYQQDKADIIHAYTYDETRLLVAYKELPEALVNHGVATEDASTTHGDAQEVDIEWDDI